MRARTRGVSGRIVPSRGAKLLRMFVNCRRKTTRYSGPRFCGARSTTVSFLALHVRDDVAREERTLLSREGGWTFMILPRYHSGLPLGLTHTFSRGCVRPVVSARCNAAIADKTLPRICTLQTYLQSQARYRACIRIPSRPRTNRWPQTRMQTVSDGPPLCSKRPPSRLRNAPPGRK